MLHFKRGWGPRSPISPRSPWARTWMSASPGFFSWASSGLSLSAPGLPASPCALTDSVWTWPVDVWELRHVTGEKFDFQKKKPFLWCRGSYSNMQKTFAIIFLYFSCRVDWLFTMLLTFMYLTSMSVFFSSSMMTSRWNLLNCAKKGPKFITTSTLLLIAHFWMHTTAESCVNFVIREEWPSGMYDNEFLRGWDFAHRGCLISRLWLTIYNFPLSQSNYSVLWTVSETCACFLNFPDGGAVSHVSFNLIFLSRYPQHLTLTAGWSGMTLWRFCSRKTFFHPTVQLFRTLWKERNERERL